MTSAVRLATSVIQAVARCGRLYLVAVIGLMSTAAVRAQGVPASSRTVSGRVVSPDSKKASVRPVKGVWVVLHRVGTDAAAPLDSVITDHAGRYSFRYRPSGDTTAVYFVSAQYAGLAYFSAPLREVRVTGEAAELTVFDTTSASIPLHVRGRHLVIAAPRVDGTREIVEVFELSNDTSVTLVSHDGVTPTFSSMLPPGASGVDMGQGDVAADAVRVVNGRLLAVAPIAPGIKQFSFSYQLSPPSFPLSVLLDREVAVLEVLAEEPGASAEGARLTEVNPVSVEGRTFRRYLAQSAPVNSVIRISVPSVGGARRSNALYISMVAIAIGIAMLIALAASFTRWRRT
ncbi:MAG: carboxypeptidase-like regulatory domain-containing protein [Gemmatimonadaceae bacterium]